MATPADPNPRPGYRPRGKSSLATHLTGPAPAAPRKGSTPPVTAPVEGDEAVAPKNSWGIEFEKAGSVAGEEGSGGILAGLGDVVQAINPYTTGDKVKKGGILQLIDQAYSLENTLKGAGSFIKSGATDIVAPAAMVWGLARMELENNNKGWENALGVERLDTSGGVNDAFGLGDLASQMGDKYFPTVTGVSRSAQHLSQDALLLAAQAGDAVGAEGYADDQRATVRREEDTASVPEEMRRGYMWKYDPLQAAMEDIGTAALVSGVAAKVLASPVIKGATAAQAAATESAAAMSNATKLVSGTASDVAVARTGLIAGDSASAARLATAEANHVAAQAELSNAGRAMDLAGKANVQAAAAKTDFLKTTRGQLYDTTSKVSNFSNKMDPVDGISKMTVSLGKGTKFLSDKSGLTKALANSSVVQDVRALGRNIATERDMGATAAAYKESPANEFELVTHKRRDINPSTSESNSAKVISSGNVEVFKALHGDAWESVLNSSSAEPLVQGWLEQTFGSGHMDEVNSDGKVVNPAVRPEDVPTVADLRAALNPTERVQQVAALDRDLASISERQFSRAAGQAETVMETPRLNDEQQAVYDTMDESQRAVFDAQVATQGPRLAKLTDAEIAVKVADRDYETGVAAPRESFVRDNDLLVEPRLAAATARAAADKATRAAEDINPARVSADAIQAAMKTDAWLNSGELADRVAGLLVEAERVVDDVGYRFADDLPEGATIIDQLVGRYLKKTAPGSTPKRVAQVKAALRKKADGIKAANEAADRKAATAAAMAGPAGQPPVNLSQISARLPKAPVDWFTDPAAEALGPLKAGETPTPQFTKDFLKDAEAEGSDGVIGAAELQDAAKAAEKSAKYEEAKVRSIAEDIRAMQSTWPAEFQPMFRSIEGIIKDADGDIARWEKAGFPETAARLKQLQNDGVGRFIAAAFPEGSTAPAYRPGVKAGNFIDGGIAPDLGGMRKVSSDAAKTHAALLTGSPEDVAGRIWANVYNTATNEARVAVVAQHGKNVVQLLGEISDDDIAAPGLVFDRLAKSGHTLIGPGGRALDRLDPIGPDTMVFTKGQMKAFQRTFESKPTTNPFLKGLTTTTSIMKAAMLPLSPSWHVGNFIGNVAILVLQADMSVSDIVRLSSQALLVRKVIKAGGDIDGLTREQMASLVSGGLSADTRLALIENTTGLIKGDRNKVMRVLDKSYAAAALVDDVAKIILYLDGTKTRGFSPTQAMKLTESAFGNMARMTKFEREFMRTVIPFYSWMRVMNRNMLKLPLVNPQRALWLNTMNLRLPADRRDEEMAFGLMMAPGGETSNPSKLFGVYDPQKLTPAGLLGGVNPLLNTASQVALGRGTNGWAVTGKDGVDLSADGMTMGTRANIGFNSIVGLAAPLTAARRFADGGAKRNNDGSLKVDEFGVIETNPSSGLTPRQSELAKYASGGLIGGEQTIDKAKQAQDALEQELRDLKDAQRRAAADARAKLPRFKK